MHGLPELRAFGCRSLIRSVVQHLSEELGHRREPVDLAVLVRPQRERADAREDLVVLLSMLWRSAARVQHVGAGAPPYGVAVGVHLQHVSSLRHHIGRVIGDHRVYADHPIDAVLRVEVQPDVQLRIDRVTGSRLDEIGGPTTSPQYPTGWAMASNTPLKRYKGTTHAGGVRDPLIVCWPAGLGEHAGAVRRQYHHVSDITPTMLELLGIVAPETVGGVEQMPLEGTSMSTTLQSATAPTPKEAQYFEMYGRRAIWHDGWKAVSFHAKGDDYANDVWELYDTEHDFAEVHDLATAEPERLAVLVERWWEEARAHNVLPLDDRSVERFLTPKPKPITERSRFVYYPDVRVPSYSAPDVRDVSYTITVRVDCTGIDVASGAADGVLVCLGDRFCGYSMFAHEGTLVHDYNCAGHHYVARSSAPLPAGPCELRYTFTKTGRLQGHGTVTIDGAAAGSVDVARTLSTHLSPAPLTVGRGPLSPVSALYDAPFPFGGVLHTVVYEIGNDRAGVPTSPFLD